MGIVGRENRLYPSFDPSVVYCQCSLKRISTKVVQPTIDINCSPYATNLYHEKIGSSQGKINYNQILQQLSHTNSHSFSLRFVDIYKRGLESQSFNASLQFFPLIRLWNQMQSVLTTVQTQVLHNQMSQQGRQFRYSIKIQKRWNIPCRMTNDMKQLSRYWDFHCSLQRLAFKDASFQVILHLCNDIFIGICACSVVACSLFHSWMNYLVFLVKAIVSLDILIYCDFFFIHHIAKNTASFFFSFSILFCLFVCLFWQLKIWPWHLLKKEERNPLEPLLSNSP